MRLPDNVYPLDPQGRYGDTLADRADRCAERIDAMLMFSMFDDTEGTNDDETSEPAETP
jgi:hypothetical protein